MSRTSEYWRHQIFASLLFLLFSGCHDHGPPPTQTYPSRDRRSDEQWPAGLNREQWDVLVHAESLELHYVNPEVSETTNNFHGHEILGTVHVSKSSDMKEITYAMARAMDRETVVADCFLPRHAIRVSKKYGTLDLLICFECDGVHVFSPFQKASHHHYSSISDGPAKILDRFLAGQPNKIVK